MNRPPPGPSKEGKRPTRAQPQFPSWEGSGVGSRLRCAVLKPWKLPMNLAPKAALKTHALQTLALAPWDKRRGVWAARRAGYPTGRVSDALLRREAFGVRASLAPLFRRRSPKVRFRGLTREPPSGNSLPIRWG